MYVKINDLSAMHNTKIDVDENRKILDDYLQKEAEACNGIAELSALSEVTKRSKLNELLKIEANLTRLKLCFQMMELISRIKTTRQSELKNVSVTWSNEDAAWVESLLTDSLSDSTSVESYYSSTKKSISDADEGFTSLKYLCKLAGSILSAVFTSTKSTVRKDEPNYVFDPSTNTIDIINAMDSTVVRYYIHRIIYLMKLLILFCREL